MAKARYRGMMPPQKKKVGTLFAALAFAIVATLGVFLAPVTASTAHTFEFTQAELNNNWEADREFPTDGVTSVSAFDRDNVARIGVNSEETHTNTFRRTEGIKTVGDNNFGDAVEVDLYLDPDWENKAVRAGIWVVGDDGTEARDNLFGILEFVNLEPSSSGDSADGDHEGWRIWDSTTGWTNVGTHFEYGQWFTLKIELDTAAPMYNFYIDNELVGSGPGGENFIREVFLNSYNYGLDEFPNLSNDSYAAHWHGGVATATNPTSKDECKQGGFANFGFSNQGQCVRFVNTDKDSR